MTSLGIYLDYQVFVNSEGFLEGYKSKGKKIQLDSSSFIFSDHERIITPCKTPEEFVKYVSGLKQKKDKIKKEPLPELPFKDEENYGS